MSSKMISKMSSKMSSKTKYRNSCCKSRSSGAQDGQVNVAVENRQLLEPLHAMMSATADGYSELNEQMLQQLQPRWSMEMLLSSPQCRFTWSRCCGASGGAKDGPFTA